jgi:hypothetical protein
MTVNGVWEALPVPYHLVGNITFRADLETRFADVQP